QRSSYKSPLTGKSASGPLAPLIPACPWTMCCIGGLHDHSSIGKGTRAREGVRPELATVLVRRRTVQWFIIGGLMVGSDFNREFQGLASRLRWGVQMNASPVKQLFLWALESESSLRRRELGERNLPFAQLTMAVILGVVIQGAATSLSRESLLRNYRAILIITALLLFVEMYIVLLRYHSRLHLPYVNLYMFNDLLISILFVSCVTLIADSWDHQAQLDVALEVLGVLFIALLARQVFAFINLVLRSKDVASILQYRSQSDRLKAISFDLVFR